MTTEQLNAVAWASLVINVATGESPKFWANNFGEMWTCAHGKIEEAYGDTPFLAFIELAKQAEKWDVLPKEKEGWKQAFKILLTYAEK